MKKNLEKELYKSLKQEFIQNHVIERVYTSPMIDNKYTKEYITTDGKYFKELMTIFTEEIEMTGEYKNITIKSIKEVRFLKTEYFSTDDSKSRFYLEQY